MPRPGFYNDNEYRAYPFIFKPLGPDETTIPNSAIVDCGVIMGLDSEFDGEQHSVWLKAVRRVNNVFEFEFDTDAPGTASKPLIFRRDVNAEEWLTEDAEADPYVKDVNSCAVEPVWSGFLVTGPLTELRAALPTNGSLSLGQNYILEPARIQSLVKTYLRAISLGNLSRPIAQSLCDQPATGSRYVVINKRCVTGDIRFKEGYNAQIRQRQLAREIAIAAGRNLGMQFDADICETHGEIPFYPNEPKPVLFPATATTPEVRSKFLSGGPACDELVNAINGVPGPDVNIIGGTGVEITADPETNTIFIDLSAKNIAGNC
jgi:hypothetical protein